MKQKTIIFLLITVGIAIILLTNKQVKAWIATQKKNLSAKKDTTKKDTSKADTSKTNSSPVSTGEDNSWLTAPINPNRVLKYGVIQSHEVYVLQQAINTYFGDTIGYTIDEDGDFGTTTEQALYAATASIGNGVFQTTLNNANAIGFNVTQFYNTY